MTPEMHSVTYSPIPPIPTPLTPAFIERDSLVPIQQIARKLHFALGEAVGQGKSAAQDSLKQRAVVLKKSTASLAAKSSCALQTGSIELIKDADASSPGSLQKDNPSHPSAAVKSPQPSRGDVCEALMQQIPFDVLKESLPVPFQASVEGFVKSSLPSLFIPLIQGAASSKVRYPVPSLGELTIRCGAIKGSGDYEAYLRYLVIEGGIKLINKQIFLSGPNRGKVYAYAKIRNDSHYSERAKEVVHEFFTSKLFQSSSYIVPMELVKKRKNSASIKGLRMPWYTNEDLFAYIAKSAPGASSYKERLLLAVDIAKGLLEMHMNKIGHMDLKPGNIVLQKDAERLRGSICDLGRATRFGVVHVKPVSSRPYLAPEQISSNVQVTPAMDMWSFGLILLELMHGMDANPYLLATRAALDEKWFSDPKMFPMLQQKWFVLHACILEKLRKSPDPANRLIEQLLDTLPERRPTAADAIKKLEQLASSPYGPQSVRLLPSDRTPGTIVTV